jgi:Tetratricopeptide repeat
MAKHEHENGLHRPKCCNTYVKLDIFISIDSLLTKSLSMTLSRIGLVTLALSAVVHAGAASAQVSTPEQQQTLDRMRASPTDHENTFSYVRASIAARDYEAAIAALERILQFNPGLSRAQYELGVLYFRLGSFAKAVLHFETASADTSLDPAIRRRLDGFLPDARKELEQSRFSGIFQTGIRVSSNKNGNVFSQNPLFNIGFPLRNSTGTSAFLMGEVNHIYDFQNQRGDRWETALAGYANQPFNNRDLNVGFFDISTGPRLALAPDILPGLTIRPYVTGSSSYVGGSSYGNSIGGGVSLRAPVTPFFALEFGLDGRRVEVNTPAGLFNRDIISSGTLWTSSVGAQWSITDSMTFKGKAFIRRNNADGIGFDSNHTGLEASLKIDFDPPTDAIGFRWSMTPFIRYTSVAFRQTEIINANAIRRRDEQLRAGLQLDMPITRYLGFSGSFEHTQNLSNIRNYRSTGWSVMAGPTLRF